ncbi:MAG: exodeoxyribonuclease VII small subunit [Eubacterium sp.]|nr:exodeoxyribonuclease VII small subunit [Eubacterium sp.]MDE6155199.1 exodeoxyribonuclease VII small subunit [Eubacterium sp.]
MTENNEMTYETAIKRLEEIVDALDKNEVSLDESMKLFEEGTKLTAFCSSKLKEAEQKITELSK